MKSLQTPHLDKINAAINNSKTPQDSKKILKSYIGYYNKWKSDLLNLTGDYESIIEKSVKILNEYKFKIDYELIYNSSNDFLYRQKGQLKLDNSVIEEFLPLLSYKLFPKAFDFLSIGSISCLSGISFENQINLNDDFKLNLRTKDQDFAISKPFKINDTANTNIALLAAECKTNLDKTMYQEATSTANDIKKILPISKYFLICEFLDMKPISSKGSPIDEVLILRKAKRLSSDVRKNFNTQKGRINYASQYKKFLLKNEINYKVIMRLFDNISLMISEDNNLNNFLKNGYF